MTSRLRLLQLRPFGKSPLGACLRLNAWLWSRLPESLTTVRWIRAYGAMLHALARLQPRRQSFGTFFLRNRAELELMRRLADRFGDGTTMRIAVLACSIGAEPYSILSAIRSAQPDLKVLMHAVDVSEAALEFAERGVYTLTPSAFHDPSIFQRLTECEIQTMFDRVPGALRIQSGLRQGITWHRADAGDPQLREVLGLHDIVVANRFLCHMDPPDAERCLRNIATLIEPGGHLFVSGVDLNVRTKVARELGWKPHTELIEAIHDGDPSLRGPWPCRYTGLEPLDKARHDWRVRYASVFEVGERS